MSQSYELMINGERREVDAAPNTPLLWVLRDLLGLTGTRFGCGRALCGACTVHLDGQAIRSCVTPISAAAGRAVTTIEGLGEPDNLHPLAGGLDRPPGPQCGFCQSGQLMSAAALLQNNPDPTDAEIDRYMAGNICRCGTYLRIRAAIRSVAEDKP